MQHRPYNAATAGFAGVSHESFKPAADAKGYVKLPNVDTLVEALDMKEAQRAYEANARFFNVVNGLLDTFFNNIG